jgi:CheY-like chemotaxis protein
MEEKMGSKVLLADDSITIQKVVAIIFANEDYELTVVDNGDAALQKARESIPDVVLVDALMPGKNGYEVCQEMRRDPVLKNVPLLLMTGAFEPFDEDKARQCGADDFISKPFESQNLIDVANKLIALGRERQAGQAVSAPVAEPAWTEPAGFGFADETITAEPTEFAGSEPVAASPAAGSPPATEPVAVSTDDDLWGVFDLEEASAGTAVAVEAPAGMVEDFAVSATDESFTFAEEESVTPASAAGAGFEPYGEHSGRSGGRVCRERCGRRGGLGNPLG